MRLVKLLISLAAGLSAIQAPAKTYKVGFLGGITGPAAPMYAPNINGLEDAVKYINEKKLLGEDTLKVVIRDDAYRADKAKQGFEDLLNEEVVAIVGPGTGNALALKKDADAEGILLISYSSADDVPKDTKTVYTTLPTDSQQVSALLKFVSEKNKDRKTKTNIAFFINPSAFGRAPVEEAKKLVEGTYKNLNIVEIIEHGDELDQTSAVQRLAKNKVEYVITHTFNFKVVPLLKSAEKVNLKAKSFGEEGKITFLGTLYAGNTTLIDLAGQSAEGFLWATGEGSLYEKNEFNDVVAELVAANKRDNKFRYSSGYRGGIITGQFMAEIITRAKAQGAVTQKSVLDVIYQMNGAQSYKTDYAIAPWTLSKTKNVGTDAVMIYQIKDGKFVPFSGNVL